MSLNLPHSNRIPFRKSIFIVGMGLIGTYSVAILGSVIQYYLGHVDPNMDATLDRMNRIPLWLIFVLFIGPIFEEYVFRKIVLTKCMKIWPTLLTCCITSLAFAALHLNWFFFPFFLNSMIYSAIYLKTNRITEASIVHILYNLTVLFLSFN